VEEFVEWRDLQKKESNNRKELIIVREYEEGSRSMKEIAVRNEMLAIYLDEVKTRKN
jgi:hypothetical protein